VSNLLNLNNIDAGYGEFDVLKNINMYLDKHEIVALIGPNGAGKSTILKSIFNISDIKSGKIFFEENDITNKQTYELLNLGISYVPQGRINFATLTVKDNLLIGAELIKDKKKVKDNLNYIYSLFSVLKTKRKHLAYSLSGGEQQMLALGRALMDNPKVLLLDEPSLGLSPKLVKETFETITKLAKTGLSILIVEQNAKQALRMADRTYLLENGQIALEGNKKLLNHPKIKTIYLGGQI
jgi:branched-chain amino acid transport system ATP-binding protein